MARRRKNPSPVGILLGIGAAGVVGFFGWRYYKDQESKKAKKPSRKKKDLPPPPDDADQYGLVINADCTDFEYSEPPPGEEAEGRMKEQAEEMFGMVEQWAASGEDMDPLEMASAMLEGITGRCEWPPDPNAPERIVQLFLYMAHVAALGTIMSGGMVLGMKGSEDEPIDPDELDAKLLELGELAGYPPFDPTVVPELIPEAQQPKLGGGDPFAPRVEKLIPDKGMPGPNSYQVVVDGQNVAAGTEFLLHDDAQMIDAQIQVSYTSPTTPMLTVTTPKDGAYRLYVRKEGNTDWVATDAILSVAPLIGGLDPKEPLDPGVGEPPKPGIDLG